MADLLQDLGYRPPGAEEEGEVLRRGAGGEALGYPGAGVRIAAAILSRDPLISYSGIAGASYFGLPGALGERLRDRPAWFLLAPLWSIEEPRIVAALRAAAVHHRLRNPKHRLVFVCNTPEECDLLQDRGEAALFFNAAAAVSEEVFRPLEQVAPDFDAVYNAQLLAFKRHELTVDIRRCAFLCYQPQATPQARAAQAAILARHGRISGHVFINEFGKDGRPVFLAPRDVNRTLNRARVGLCLSATEGAMYANVEYLLAGLPVVTTPSRGGRHIYHDPAYCRTVAPDPRAVAEAVEALAATAIPRAHVRERTLRRLAADRERFLDLLDSILAASGSRQRMERPWPFRNRGIINWLTAEDAADRAAFGLVDAFGKPRKGLLPWRLRRMILARQRRRSGS